MEDSIYLARIIKEIYSGIVSTDQIPVNIDSKTPLDSFNADVFTKKHAKTDAILTVVTEGNLMLN